MGLVGRRDSQYARWTRPRVVRKVTIPRKHTMKWPLAEIASPAAPFHAMFLLACSSASPFPAHMSTPACLPAGCLLQVLCVSPTTQLRTMSHYPTFQTRGSECWEAGVAVWSGPTENQPQTHIAPSPIISPSTLGLQEEISE